MIEGRVEEERGGKGRYGWVGNRNAQKITQNRNIFGILGCPLLPPRVIALRHVSVKYNYLLTYIFIAHQHTDARY